MARRSEAGKAARGEEVLSKTEFLNKINGRVESSVSMSAMSVVFHSLCRARVRCG